MSVDPLEFRQICGRFATGVTIITAADGDLLQGMTANAFTALSLDPVMVLICVARDAHTHGVLERGGAFAVNILADDQQDVSRLFAHKAEPEVASLRGLAYRRGHTGAPILEDCLAFLECRIADVLQGGDHSIFLGEVVDQAVVRDDSPLLFFRGAYATLTPSS